MSRAPEDHIGEAPSSFPWPPVLLVAALAAAWVADLLHPLPWPGLNDTPAHVIGIALGAGGLALMAWAMATLRRQGTTVMPHAGATRLVTSGPFGYLRNPIYLADVMVMLGLAELTQNVWFVIYAAVFGVLVTWLAILPEERHLEARFGKDYLDYKSRTRRWV
jgi:protein-S-isoprenylcysteine O-methyltransferase Ste14